MAQKVANHLGYFDNKMCCLELLKIHNLVTLEQTKKGAKTSVHRASDCRAKTTILFFKNGPIQALFVYFLPFLITISIIQIEKSVVGVLGIRTRGHSMVGADKTTELWRPPKTSVLRTAVVEQR